MSGGRLPLLINWRRACRSSRGTGLSDRTVGGMAVCLLMVQWPGWVRHLRHRHCGIHGDRSIVRQGAVLFEQKNPSRCSVLEHPVPPANTLEQAGTGLFHGPCSKTGVSAAFGASFKTGTHCAKEAGKPVHGCSGLLHGHTIHSKETFHAVRPPRLPRRENSIQAPL